MMSDCFPQYTLTQIDKADNYVFDYLSKLVEGDKETLEGSIYFEDIKILVVGGQLTIEVTMKDPTWITPIVDYL